MESEKTQEYASNYKQNLVYFTYSKPLLDTEKLTESETIYILDLIEEFIDDLKTNNHKNKDLYKNLFCFKFADIIKDKYDYKDKLTDFYTKYLYEIDNDIDLIDIENFIKSKIKDKMKDEFSNYRNDLYSKNITIFLEKDDLIQQANLYIIRRIKNNYNLEYKNNYKKTLNTFFNYIKITVYSAVYHYFRDVYNTNLVYDEDKATSSINFNYLAQYDISKILTLDIPYASNILEPEKKLLHKELYCEFLSRIFLLPIEDLEIFNDIFFKNMTQKEIAEKKGVTQQAISKRFNKIKKVLNQIKKQLKNY